MTTANISSEQIGKALLQNDIGVIMPLPTTSTAHPWHPRGWRGCLKDMQTLPLDLLFEIFCYLNPKDVLSFARSTRDFRALLMSKTSSSVWMTARRNVAGLPECPYFLSEPAYANLVFDTNCHGCSKRKAKLIVWEYRARYCHLCIERRTIREVNLQLPDGLVCQDLFLVIRASQSHPKTDTRVHTLDLDSFLRAWEITDSEKRRSLVEQQEQLKNDIYKFAESCVKWIKDRKKALAEYQIEMQSIRFRRVLEKLTQLGWGDELEYMAKVGYFPLVAVPFVVFSTPWDELDWDKAKERVIATMEAWKSNRLRSERVQLLMTRIKTMMLFVLSFRREYGKEAFPRARDFAALPEIQEIIDVPAEEEVTPESFTKLAPTIPRIVADWQQERFQYFETLLRERLDSTHCNVYSQLAVDQFFECGCGRLFDYQNMIAHDCNVDLSNSVSASIYEEAADRATQSRADVKITPFIVPVMGILEACRKDYHKCTAKEMDDSDIRLHCETCEVFHQGSGSRIFQVMNWRVAARHVARKQQRGLGGIESPSCVWHVLDADKTAIVMTLEKTVARLTAQDDEIGYRWVCAHCLQRRLYTKAQANAHVRTTHCVDFPLDHRDILLHSGPDFEPHRVHLVANKMGFDQLPLSYQQLIHKGSAALVDMD